MNARILTTFPSLVLLTTALLGACTTAATRAAIESSALILGSSLTENVQT